MARYTPMKRPSCPGDWYVKKDGTRYRSPADNRLYWKLPRKMPKCVPDWVSHNLDRWPSAPLEERLTIQKAVGALIRARRLEQGFTQSGVARWAHMSPNMYVAMERGVQACAFVARTIILLMEIAKRREQAPRPHMRRASRDPYPLAPPPEKQPAAPRPPKVDGRKTRFQRLPDTHGAPGDKIKRLLESLDNQPS